MLYWLFSLACLSKPTELPPPLMDTASLQSRIDWSTVGDESVSLLQQYIQIDTINPEGNETRGADFLASVLDTEGISYEIHESSPGRGNLIARLKATGEPTSGPLCMLSHIDVVPAESEKWEHPPLSGALVDGYIWGRGALDMKSMGIMELMTMVLLKRQNIPLNRDVILLAVADEEVRGEGVRYVADTYWQYLGCEHVVNEGGLGLEDMLFEGQTVYPISVAEKGSVWLKMVAMGEPGHGSTPRPNEAPKYLLEAIETLSNRDLDPSMDGPIDQFVVNIGAHKGGIEGFALQNTALRHSVVKNKLMDNPITRAAIINTVHVTGFGGENNPNVVPSEVYAILDCRIQPGVDPQEFIAYLESMVSEHIRFDVISTSSGSESPMDDPFYYALARHAVAGEDNAVAGPVVSVGYTDSNYLRPLGAKAYGFVPVALTAEDMEGFHGHNEKISVQNMHDGTRKLFLAVTEVSARSLPEK